MDANRKAADLRQDRGCEGFTVRVKSNRSVMLGHTRNPSNRIVAGSNSKLHKVARLFGPCAILKGLKNG
jgi:aconitase B